MEATNLLETYGFELDERLEKEEYEEFCVEYSKVLSRRKKRWESIDVSKMKKGGKEKRFIRKGIPSALRADVWLQVSGVKEKMRKEPDRFKSLLEKELPDNLEDAIMTDVPRTFPENANFRGLKGHDPNGLSRQLMNVLKALAAAKAKIGYCQGLNFVAAVLLLVVRKEEEAFWLLEHLLTDIIPEGYYTPSMEDLKRDFDVMADLVRMKIPDVSERVKAEEVSYIVVCTKWFICLYCDTLPFETCLRILDCLFSEGDKVLFRVALTLIKLNSEKLVACSNFPKLVTAFQSGITYDRKTLFCHEFMENIFKKPGKLSKSQIRKLRLRYQNQAELENGRVEERK